jgi:tRNA dimethylallyltransferase
MSGMNSTEPSLPLLAIVGATASGKNELAQKVARAVGASLISVDSRKVYRGLDIGTAKPSPELIREFDYAMIDCADPSEYFSAGRFAREARLAIESRSATGRPVILVGGTGFYLDALINGLAEMPQITPSTRERFDAAVANRGWPALYEELKIADSAMASQVHPGDKTRIRRGLEICWESGQRLSDLLEQERSDPLPWPIKVLWIERERQALNERIATRVARMRAAGLTAEVGRLLEAGIPGSAPGLATVGYQELVSFFAGRQSEDQAYDLVVRNTRRYAKRQGTWFRHRQYAHSLNSEGVALERIMEFWRD